MVDIEKPADAAGPVENLELQGFDKTPEDDGLPLDELTEAYAHLLDRGGDPYQDAAPAADHGVPIGLTEETLADQDDGCPIAPRSILEAMLFVGHPDNVPISGRSVAALMRGVRPQEIDALVRELNETYAAEGCAYRIASVGSGYRMVLGEEFGPLRDKFHGRIRQARLSQAAIDVLAVVAYHQPVGREEIDRIRGRPSGGVLRLLVRRQLLRVERDQAKPRQPHYYTTDRFLEVFDLRSLDDLPRSQELDRS